MARRSKKQPEATPSDDGVQHVAPALAAVIEKANLATADQLPIPSHVERHRPTGPRKKPLGEPPIQYQAVDDFDLVRAGRNLAFIFKEEPSNERIKKLGNTGFYRRNGTTTWEIPASPETADAAAHLANDFAGKAYVYAGQTR